MQKELEEACRDTRAISPEELPGDLGLLPKHSAVPTKATVKFVSCTKCSRFCFCWKESKQCFQSVVFYLGIMLCKNDEILSL